MSIANYKMDIYKVNSKENKGYIYTHKFVVFKLSISN